MASPDLVIPPPSPKLLDYPSSLAVALAVVFASIMLFVASRFDPTGGVLTISLLIVLTFIGVVAFCVLFTVPTDEATAAVIGALVLAMGAVVAHWLGRAKGGP